MANRPASDKQLRFLQKLLTERGQEVPEDLFELDMQAASKTIDALLKTPKESTPNSRQQGTMEPRVAPRWTSLSQSRAVGLTGLRSAVYTVGGTTYQIDAPGPGKWEGWVFVKGLDGTRIASQRPREFARVAPGVGLSDSVLNVLAAIAADPVAAVVAYALETGRCSVCQRELKDDLSRASGIGPICAVAWGVDRREYQEVADRLRAEREQRAERLATVVPSVAEHQAAQEESWDAVRSRVDELDVDQELAGIAAAGVLDPTDNPFDLEPDYEAPAVRSADQGPDELPAIPSVMDGQW